MIAKLSALILAAWMAATSGLYTTPGYVQETSPADDGAELVTVCNPDGHIREFFTDPGDYERGDVCRMLMWDANTPDVPEDDVVVYEW